MENFTSDAPYHWCRNTRLGAGVRTQEREWGVHGSEAQGTRQPIRFRAQCGAARRQGQLSGSRPKGVSKVLPLGTTRSPRKPEKPAGAQGSDPPRSEGRGQGRRGGAKAGGVGLFQERGPHRGEGPGGPSPHQVLSSCASSRPWSHTAGLQTSPDHGAGRGRPPRGAGGGQGLLYTQAG